MAWLIEFDEKAKKAFNKLDRAVQQRIVKYLKRIETQPLSYAETLSGEFIGLYKFRVGDYRLISRIEEGKMTVLIIKIGHRREIYEH